MSYNRLRRLAGLKESFTDDPSLNTEIENRVFYEDREHQHQWMDILETIYNAGANGIDRDELIYRIETFDPNARPLVHDMLDVVNDLFRDFVRENHDRFFWLPTHGEPVPRTRSSGLREALRRLI